MTNREIDAMLDYHGFTGCTHPDCGPTSCASGIMRERARALVRDVLARKPLRKVRPGATVRRTR